MPGDVQPSRSERRLAYNEQHVYRVTVSVPVPEIPDTWSCKHHWKRLLEMGSIVYITKDYTVAGKRLKVTCDMPMADGWDRLRGRPYRPSAGEAIAHVVEAVRFDVAWVLDRLNENGYGTLPRVDDVRASAKYLKTIPAMTETERIADREAVSS